MWPQSGVVVVGDVVGNVVVVVVVGSLVGSGLLSPWHLSGSLQGLECMKYDAGRKTSQECETALISHF